MLTYSRMPSYLRFTPPPLEVSSVRPRLIPFQLACPGTSSRSRNVGTGLTVLVALGCLACGGAGPGKLAPQSPQETLAQFLSAVNANDLERMRTLWGSERGLASSHLKSTDVNQRLAVLQIYLNHVGYRVVEGPLPVPNKDDRRLLRVELQRSTSCTVVVPIELARTKEGRWLVVGTDLASIPNPAAACKS